MAVLIKNPICTLNRMNLAWTLRSERADGQSVVSLGLDEWLVGWTGAAWGLGPQTPPRGVVEFYNGRGTCEQWIKEGKYALGWMRLSCQQFENNALRLALFVLAYNVGNFLRRLAVDSTQVLGRGAVEDTYNLIAHGIAKLVGHAQLSPPSRGFHLGAEAVTEPDLRADVAHDLLDHASASAVGDQMVAGLRRLEAPLPAVAAIAPRSGLVAPDHRAGPDALTYPRCWRVMRDMAASPGVMVAASVSFGIQDRRLPGRFRLFLDTLREGGTLCL